MDTALFDPLIEDRLNEALLNHDTEALHNIIELHNSPKSQNIFDIIAWLLGHQSESSTENPPDFENFAKLQVQKLSRFLTSKEFLLVILGELGESESLHLLSFSMCFLKSCAISIGLGSTGNMKSLFSGIRMKFHMYLSTLHNEHPREMNSVFITLLKDVADLLKTLFSQDLDANCFETYTDDILYYFAEPLQFVDCNDKTIPLFESFLSVLRKIVPSIYSSTYEFYRLAYTSPNIESYLTEFSDNFNAFLFIWNLCLSNGVFLRFLPCIFTKFYKFEVLVYLSIPFVQKLTIALSQKRFLSPIDIKQLIRVEEGLMKNSSDLNNCYPYAWWQEQVVSLLENFVSICKYPIMGSEIPTEIKNCVFSIESLLSTASVTARCELYAKIINGAARPFHNGLLSHMIVNFKNFLHSELTALEEERVLNEEKLGETNVILPYYPNYLHRMFDLIFIYPLPECDENIINQSDWLNAALNFAFYLISRYNFVKNGDFDKKLKDIMEHVAITFNRRDDKEKSVIKSRFLEPLNEDIAKTASLYKRAKAEYESDPNPSTVAPNAPSLHQCDMILTNLHMLITNISVVQELIV